MDEDINFLTDTIAIISFYNEFRLRMLQHVLRIWLVLTFKISNDQDFFLQMLWMYYFLWTLHNKGTFFCHHCHKLLHLMIRMTHEFPVIYSKLHLCIHHLFHETELCNTVLLTISSSYFCLVGICLCLLFPFWLLLFQDFKSATSSLYSNWKLIEYLPLAISTD